MLNPLDDYPIHQTPEPLAQTVSGDRNHYDRFWFNGYDATGSVYFGAALGVYPNREVMDGAFSVVHDGVQTSVHASRRAPADRTQCTVGPLSVRVDEPLRRLTITVGPNEADVSASLTFTARTAACEEPRFTRRTPAGRVVMDYTRLTQFGSWAGWISVGGTRIEVSPDLVVGTRDRSWGVRPVGERETGAPGGLPQFFWLWAPVNFDDVATHFDVQEDGEGRRWHHNGVVLPVIGPADPVVDGGTPMADASWSIAWRPGTRRASSARVTLTPFDAAPHVIELEPILDFQMSGLGYFHPEWSHGVWKGAEAVGVESAKLADLDPMAIPNIHVQQLCRATMGSRVGTGILESLIIGPHVPSGFTSILDPAPLPAE